MLIFDGLPFITVVLLANVIYSSEASQNQNFTRPNISIFRADDDTKAAAQPRIVGGEPARLKDFPWTAYLLYKNITVRFGCTASIINPSTILTAAACADYDPNQMRGRFIVKAGNLKLNEVDRFEQRVSVEEVFIHPGYSADVRGDYDIAILKLKEPLRMTSRVQSVELPEQTKARSLYKRNNCVLTGYGYISYPEEEFPNVLQKAEITIRSKGFCKRLAPIFQFGKLLCSYHPGRGVCYGDTGGPLVCYDKKDRAYQVGVASRNDRCQGGSIYVSVPRKLKWIQQYT